MEKHTVRQDEKETKRNVRGVFGNWFGLLLVIICCICFFYVVANLNHIFGYVGFLFSLITPVIYGAVIAFLLNPLMKSYHRLILYPFSRGDKVPSKRMTKVSYGISIGLALVSGILIITILGFLIVPQLLNSIISLSNTLPTQADNYYQYIVHKIENNPFLAQRLQEMVLNATNMLDNWVNNELYPWLRSELLPNVNSLAKQFADGLMNFLNVLYNLFIGCIVAIYLLSGKEKFIAQAKKGIYGLFGKKQADVVLHYTRITNEMFSGFISGKIVDSTIIGIICFVAMSIIHLPYAMLVSVIIGVTNIIPVFGPYIGAVPSALLILIVSPIQCLYFIILIVVLQQLDGNIIGPTILGESTGLSAFWVLFSILIFGGMWGIGGMLIGVPLFAVIYRIIKDSIELRLYKKGLRTTTQGYLNLKSIYIDDKDVVHYLPINLRKQQMHAKEHKEHKEEEISLISVLNQQACIEEWEERRSRTSRRKSKKEEKDIRKTQGEKKEEDE